MSLPPRFTVAAFGAADNSGDPLSLDDIFGDVMFTPEGDTVFRSQEQDALVSGEAELTNMASRLTGDDFVPVERGGGLHTTQLMEPDMPALAMGVAGPDIQPTATVPYTKAPQEPCHLQFALPKKGRGQKRKVNDAGDERRERNREHAKRSRIRKKFLMESLQQSVTSLKEENEKLRNAVREHVDKEKAEALLAQTEKDSAESAMALIADSQSAANRVLDDPDFSFIKALQTAEQNFVVTDPELPDNPIVYASQGFLNLTGYALDQILGRNCRFLQGPETDPDTVDRIRNSIEAGEDLSVCLLNYRVDGSTFWNQVFLAPLRDSEGKIKNFVGVQCKVSDQYAATVTKEQTEKEANGYSSIMNVLEMETEEAQGLIGAGGRKKLTFKRSQSRGKDGGGAWMDFIMRRNRLTNVIAVAGVALMALLYVSAKDSTETGNPPSVGGTPTVGNPPSPSPPSDPPVALNVGDDDAGDDDAGDDDAGDDDAGDDDDSEGNDGSYLYSNYATIVPLYGETPPDEAKAEELEDKWGHWHFWDGEEEFRPEEEYMSMHPNKDVPGDEFPDAAWQVDGTFVNHYLDGADEMITRAMEVIFEEYGHPKEGLSAVELAQRMKLLHWEKIDMSTAEQKPENYRKNGSRADGGWTTKRSYKGLVRRILHAMMTSDTFTVVMGGHSAAAGQGNHFRQSYMMQFHKIMSPVFARLGVKLVTRNVGMGGLGTIHNALGAGSIYGDVDLLLWDSGMTEGRDFAAMDMFLRQGILGGNKVPAIWASGMDFDLLKMLHEEADVDIGEFGLGTNLAPEVQDAEHAKTIPWAARYMKCAEGAKTLCDEEPRFCSHCWIDRDDGITPSVNQRDHPRGQVKWHPGWRVHQLTGRNLAFALLEALQSAVTLWVDEVQSGPPLDDDEWHVTEYYENIRSKVKALDKSLGHCHEFEGRLPTRMCNTPMKARTQYTPRADFENTSITSILVPAPNGYVPKNEEVALYEGPDARNECLEIPEGEIDAYAILAGRRRLEEPFYQAQEVNSDVAPSQVAYNRSLSEIVPGIGWEVVGEPQGYCDGTYNAVCRRQGDFECVLYGHHDERGAVVGNEYAGWLVMKLADLKEGIIVIKLHTWHYASENPRTSGWTTVNNERGRERQLRVPQDEPPTQDNKGSHRDLMRSYETPDLPDTFEFDFAIDGKITTLNKDQFLEQKQDIARVVEMWTLLDDPDFTSEAKEVELAIRMRGCGDKCVFGLSHVYWA